MGKSSFIPGFRFHPTDVELVMFYLKRKLTGKKIYFDAVADVDIYAFSPWDLPDKSSLKSGDLEWYFFCPKAKKYSSGCRAKRATDTGFWKATGKDRQVKYNERLVAVIKTLIYHIGHAGKGERTDWVMHEYRMQDEQLAGKGVVLDSFVLCKIFEKSGAGPKNGAQYGKPFNEEEWEDVDLASCADFQVQGLVGASNMTDHKQKGPATSSVTEPGSSGVTLSANEPTEALNCKEKGKAVDCLSITEVGSSSMMVSATGEMPADYDVMSLEDILEDIELVMKADDGEKGKALSNGDSDSIYDDLLNLIDLDDSKLDGVEYTLDDLLADVPPYLEDFYVD